MTGVEAAIHDRIWNAILDRKLRPGAKLHEDMVGTTFGVSRTIVRKVFLIMEQEGIISLQLNRGAFVAVPAPEEVQHLFETMRLVMPYIVRNLAATLDDDMRARFEAHFEILEDGVSSQDVRTSRRLAHEGFVLLADMHGNPVLASLIERIATRTSMAATMYQDQMVDWHPAEYSRQMVDAILAKDGDKAVKIFLDSLANLEASLQLDGPDTSFDIGSILSAGEDTVYPKARRSSKPRARRTKAEMEGVKKSRAAAS